MNRGSRGDRAERRVVITGIGLVTPCGVGTDVTWRALLEGRSGIASIERFDTQGLATRFAGEVKGWDPAAFVEPRKRREMSRAIEFALGASLLAWSGAGLGTLTVEEANGAGCILGTSMGAMDVLQGAFRELAEAGARTLSPYLLPLTAASMSAAQVGIRLGLRGACFTVNSACASGAHALGEGMRAIQRGDASLMVAGGTEAWVSPLCIAAFNAMKALSLENGSPKKASRPWDKDRAGFVMGEGAGVLILEERERALARGAPICCELLGYGASNDAFHLTQPTQDGAERAMRRALRDAGVEPSHIRYINAHATSTSLGDINEVRAIRGVFGEHADGIPVSAPKSMLGHLGGAAGAVEAALAALAVRDGQLPPTANLVQPGRDCDLDFVPGAARAQHTPYALSNSFGFGGTNTALVFGEHAHVAA